MRLLSPIWTLSLLLPFTLVSPAFLTTPARADDAAPAPIDVWPGKPPGDTGKAVEEKWTKQRVENVTHPTLAFFRPAKDKDTGVAIIVCPGGGYKALMMDYEGEDVAKWLTTVGITGVVLKYRVPAPEGLPRHLPALQDAQRSISYLRYHAKELNIDPARIGILGFSAGGHLVAAAATNYDQRAYESIDAVDQISCRPDFQVPIYPGGMMDKAEDGKPADRLSPVIRVTKDTPPAFIAMANGDSTENAIFYYLALKKAGVKADLHIYTLGRHGFGIKPSTQPVSTWPDRCVEWMHSIGVLKAEASH